MQYTRIHAIQAHTFNTSTYTPYKHVHQCDATSHTCCSICSSSAPCTSMYFRYLGSWTLHFLKIDIILAYILHWSCTLLLFTLDELHSCRESERRVRFSWNRGGMYNQWHSLFGGVLEALSIWFFDRLNWVLSITSLADWRTSLKFCSLCEHPNRRGNPSRAAMSVVNLRLVSARGGASQSW